MEKLQFSAGNGMGHFKKSKIISLDNHGPRATSYAVSGIKINAEYVVMKWAIKVGNELTGMCMSWKTSSKTEGSSIKPALFSSLFCIFLFHLVTLPSKEWFDYDCLSDISKWKMLKMFFTFKKQTTNLLAFL